MAVISTFVYLSTISEASKRTIHTVLAIVTALLAETGPTRYYYTRPCVCVCVCVGWFSLS